jgi:hypothetical protein
LLLKQEQIVSFNVLIWLVGWYPMHIIVPKGVVFNLVEKSSFFKLKSQTKSSNF